jgi:DNA polymerase (family 10)
MVEANRITKYMKECHEVDKIEYAGSLRRRQETIGDIDILVTSKKKDSAKKIMDYFVKYDDVLEVTAKGDTKSSLVLQSGMDVDLRVVNSSCFGAALHYFTGSKQHNIKIRDLAKKKGLKVNEYGVFKGEKLIGGKEENDIFKAVGLPFIIPELRKDDGEVEYGLKHKSYPRFVELKDIKGDLHVHSTYSDGIASIEKMAEAMIKKGYEYFAISDHSSALGITHGMGSKDIKRQWSEVDKLNKKFKGKITILKGSEVDILKDGSLDFSNDILEQLNVVIASVHSYMLLDYDQQTKRIIAAVENPYVNILGHPTGRLINKRASMNFDMEKVIDACIENKVAIEINSNPQRLDLIYRYIKTAKDKGATFVINTDSHGSEHVNFMQYGINVARRGWLEKINILNTRKLKDLTAFFK